MFFLLLQPEQSFFHPAVSFGLLTFNSWNPSQTSPLLLVPVQSTFTLVFCLLAANLSYSFRVVFLWDVFQITTLACQIISVCAPGSVLTSHPLSPSQVDFLIKSTWIPNVPISLLSPLLPLLAYLLKTHLEIFNSNYLISLFPEFPQFHTCGLNITENNQRQSYLPKHPQKICSQDNSYTANYLVLAKI